MRDPSLISRIFVGRGVRHILELMGGSRKCLNNIIGDHTQLNFISHHREQACVTNEEVSERITGIGNVLYRSYLYAADLAIWLWTILFKGKSRHPYNVGSEVSFSIAEIAQAVAKSCGPNIKVEIRKTANPANPAERYIPSNLRGSVEIDLQTLFDLPTSIQRTMQFIRSVHA